DDPLAAPLAGATLQRRHANRRVPIRRQFDRGVSVVHPFVEIVVPGDVEGRPRPPTELAGKVGEPGTYRVTDEQIVRRHRAPHPKQRAALEALEIEAGACRIADNVAGEPIVDPATTVKMAEKGDRIPEEPCSRAGDRREDG